MILFNIRESDLIVCNRSKKADAKGEPPVTANFIDYKAFLSDYFTLATPKDEDQENGGTN